MLTGRQPGVGLAQDGVAQAERLADTLGALPIAVIVSSPLQRAQETAAPLARRLGLAVTIEPGLDEIDFGDWTGLPFADLDGRPEWEAWNRQRSLARCPGGESMLGAQARAVTAIDRLAVAHRGAELVLISHQDVLKAILAHALGLSLDHLARFSLDPAHRSVVTVFDADRRVDAVNLPP